MKSQTTRNFAIRTPTVIAFAASLILSHSYSKAAELIFNGGFESGSTSWTMAGGAAASANGGFAYSGSYFLWLGGALDEVDSAYQTITIPTNATAATLTFYWNINSLEGTSIAYDTFSATIRNAIGSVLATVISLSNKDQSAAGNPNYHLVTYSLLSYAGQTIRIHFASANDSSKVTNFRLDDVSVSVTTPTCTYSLSPTSISPTGCSGSGSITVAAGSGCTWSGIPNQSWIHTSSTGNGNGTVSYSYDANSSTNSRSGTITVQDQTFTINQAGLLTAPCPPTISGAKLSGTTFTLATTTEAGFNYVLEYKNSLSDADWIPVQTNSGTGAQTILTNTDATGPMRMYHVRVQ